MKFCRQLMRAPSSKRLSSSPLAVAIRYTWLACACSLTGCAAYNNARGHLQLHSGNAVEGIQSLEVATKQAPTNPEYKIDYLDRREESVRAVLARAEAERADGKLSEAKGDYEQVLQMDRGNVRARAALAGLPLDARMEGLLAEGEQFLGSGRLDLARERAEQVLQLNAAHRHALRLKEAVADAQAKRDAAASRLRASLELLGKPVTLQFNNAPLRTVIEAISRAVGLNILLDRDVKAASPVSIFVRDISVGDAIDFILMQNQLEKRVVNTNTIMIFPSTDTKRAEYEDLSIRSFQVTNADIKYLSGMLKSMLKLRDVSADERTGIMVIRDTPEKLRLAAKLIAVHDVPDPEIMLEVEILEVSSSRTSNIGVDPPTSFSVLTPGKAGSLTWGALRSLHRDDLLVSPLSATINFKLEDSDVKILASPRIRARNKEKAKILIGDRVPTITNTVTPIATGASVVTGNVTYQDVGLKLEFEPQVYADSEVGIKVALEVSNIAAEFTDAQGGRSYQIGTRNAITNLRLRDGETQVLGGLITDNDRNIASKIPGLGHLPIVGRLFGNNDGTASRSEIVLAITPHIVRNLAVRSPEVSDIFSGTFNVPRERPILADPIGLVRAPSAVGGSSSLPSGAAAVRPASHEAAGSLSRATPEPPRVDAPTPSSSPSHGLPAPPPMFVRPSTAKP